MCLERISKEYDPPKSDVQDEIQEYAGWRFYSAPGVREARYGRNRAYYENAQWLEVDKIDLDTKTVTYKLLEQANKKETPMLYEVAVVEVPYRQEGENSDLGEIILAPKAVMARNAETAKIIALQGLTLSKPENTVVLVRPFVTR